MSNCPKHECVYSNPEMNKYPLLILLIVISYSLQLLGQNNSGSGNQEVSVSVELSSASEIELETMRNISFQRIPSTTVDYFLDPRTDPSSGLLRATGRPFAQIQVSFQEQQTLTQIDGSGSIGIRYRVSGNIIDDQTTSVPLWEDGNENVFFSRAGEYFFWVGGILDLTNLVLGEYTGEFTIEVNYL